MSLIYFVYYSTFNVDPAVADQHYLAVRDDIEEDTYARPDRWVILSSLAILLLGTGVIYYVFNVPVEYTDNVILE